MTYRTHILGLAAGLAILWSGDAAADWRHYTSQDPRAVANKLNQDGPRPRRVQGATSTGRDYHVWYETDDSGTSWSADYTCSPMRDVGGLVEDGAILLGFNVDGCMWYLTAH